MTTSTFGMLKPDAVSGKHVGSIINRIELGGFDIEWMNLRRLMVDEAEVLYQEHLGRPFYHNLIKFTIEGPVVLMKLKYTRDPGAVQVWRHMMGDTDPRRASPGTIRRDYYYDGADLPRNMVHGSSSDVEALRELSLFRVMSR